MKRLILIRHAKSGWDDAAADDHARTLTDRGRKAAQKIGAWLADNSYTPDVLLVSDSARTIETHKHLCAGLGETPNSNFLTLLYHAAPDTILELAQKQPDETIAIIGHTPGIAMAAHGLVQSRPNHDRFSDYPTGATTVIDFTDTVNIGTGTCEAFTVPRDL